MDAEVEDEIHPSERPRVTERIAIHVPPEVELQNLDFDVNEFVRSSPNPVVASVFGDSMTFTTNGSENESRVRFNKFQPDY